jgi:hypothetical protein
MPKPPPIEYFMLSAPTPKAMLGEAVAALTKLGLSEVHFELMTDIPAFARNNSGHEVKATDFLEAFIADHPTFSQKDVTAAFKADGRLPSASYYAMTKLLEQGSIKKLDDYGNYSRTDVKHIEAPKKEKTKAKQEKPARAITSMSIIATSSCATRGSTQARFQCQSCAHILRRTVASHHRLAARSTCLVRNASRSKVLVRATTCSWLRRRTTSPTE